MSPLNPDAPAHSNIQEISSTGYPGGNTQEAPHNVPENDPLLLTVQRLQEQQQEHFAMLKTLSSENRNLKLEITELRMARLHIPEDNMEEEQPIPRVISESMYHRNTDPGYQNPEQHQPDEDLHEHRSRHTGARDDHRIPEHAAPEERHRDPEHKHRQTRRRNKHQNPETKPQDTRMDDRYQNTEYDDPDYNPRVELSD